MYYDYDRMLGEIGDITAKRHNVYRFSIGKSVMGRDIICLAIGSGKRKLLLCGAFHGLESLTAAFLVSFSDTYASAAAKRLDIFGRNAALLFNNVTIYIIPMVNPDGVDIAVNGLCLSQKAHTEIAKAFPEVNFKREWQANANGVDINHNFDAGWDSVLPSPAPSKYGGTHPCSEPETRALTSFTRRERIDMLIAFHSQGGEIYYTFDKLEPIRSKPTAEKMAEESGYIVSEPAGTAVFGGCKDWFIKEFGKEGFTVEMGHGKNPLPLDMMKEVFEPCARIILCGAEECCKMV